MMQVITEKNFVMDEACAVTIGKYDGIHIGHRRLIEKTCEYRADGLKSVMFTFDISPLSFFKGADSLIYTNEEKENIVGECGIDYMIEYPFDMETASLSPEDFFVTILVKKLNAKAVIVGEDFFFGSKRAGNAQTLKELGKKYGIAVDIIPEMMYENEPISSTLIRQWITEGSMDKVTELLGEPYSITGEVIYGKQLGRTIGIPTVNIKPEKEKLLPQLGVYASYVVVDGVTYKGVTNVGKKPTIEDDLLVGVETFILDFDKDVYGMIITVKLTDFIRPEMKFSGIDELSQQMMKDIEKAGNILSV